MKIRILIAVLLFALLAGCGSEASAPTTPQGGTLYVTANSVFAVNYDGQGKVISVTADPESDQDIVDHCQDLVGKSCAEAVSMLVEKAGQAGYLDEAATITVTFEDNSSVPEADFVKSLEQELQDTVQKNGWKGSVQIEQPVSSITPDRPTDQYTQPTAPSLPEGAEKQADGTYTLAVYLDRNGETVDSEKEAFSVQTTYYDADGKPTQEEEVSLDGITVAIKEYDGAGCPSTLTRWHSNGQKQFYGEFYPNGNSKSHKSWNESGVLMQEFAAFTDENNDNGIITAYDENGNMTYRSTFGNPDGSSNTEEHWDADGTHILSVIVDGQCTESRYTYPDGSYRYHTYDYDAGTHHVVGKGTNFSVDAVWHIDDSSMISGYQETTLEDGIYVRLEYKDGYKYKEIQDGATNHAGYKIRDTLYYYSNGQVKSTERYFYFDGGRIYYEYDENGNVTYHEHTTSFDD